MDKVINYRMHVDGFLNLDKPVRFTSHDCVARVRRLLRMKRVGHGGTLDPAATGVLPIALGRATRLLQFLRQDKAYRATIRFGVKTATDDLDGEILEQHPVPGLELAAIEHLLPRFLGTIQQIPPRYSAVQVNGKRMYALARAGEVVDVPVRTVEVKHLEILDWRSQDFPEVELAITCGAGTYIRSIARDLGQFLGTGGALASLRRTESHGFSLTNSLTLEALEVQIQAQAFQPLEPAEALSHLPILTLNPKEAKRWSQGQRLANIEGDAALLLDTPLGIYDDSKTFLGIGRWDKVDDGEVLAPWLVFRE